MSKVKLDDVVFRYVKIEITDGQEDKIGVNLREVYKYIDQHKNMGSRYPYGNAYKAIRLRATRLMGRGDMKVYKREVTSLIKYRTKLFHKNYIRIPYKMEYIFRAIFELVDELKVNYPLPQELDIFIEKIRRECFYKEQSSLYEEWFKENLSPLNKALYDDMMAGNSILSKKF